MPTNRAQALAALAKGEPFWPSYCFGDFIGPPHRWFAWHPVRLWDGRRAWLRWVWRRRVILKPYLDGPGNGWWCVIQEPHP